MSYKMASFASGKDESNPALWLATRVGKMKLTCPLGTTRRIPKEKIYPKKPYNKSCFDQVCSAKMAGYCPRKKKRTWPITSHSKFPHTWSITHTFCLLRITGRVPRVCSVLFLYNKSFIDQACSMKISGHWPEYCFAHLRTLTLGQCAWSIAHAY